jgi:PAS domain S-box-containing protein/putative nucleotidyltransferase with HDIG domain
MEKKSDRVNSKVEVKDTAHAGKQANDRLQESDELYRLLADQSILGIEVIQDGIVKYANHATSLITGYSIEEMMNWGYEGYSILLHPDESSFVMEQARKKQKGEPDILVNYTWRIISKSGETKWVESFSKTSLFKGAPSDFVMMIDITERKCAEEGLLSSEKKFSSFFKLNPLSMAITDMVTGKIIDINQSFTFWSGYSREEVIGVSAQDLHLWVNPEQREKIIETLATAEEVSGAEVMMRQKNGHVRNILFSARFIEIEQKIYLMTLAHDITERKMAEEKYRNIFENAQEGIYQSTPEGRFIMVNQSMARILEYDSPEDLISCITDIARQLYVDPEERTKFTALLEQHGFCRKYDARFYKKNGNIIWVSLTTRAVYNEKREILYYEGIVADITDKKESIERLRTALGGTVHAIASIVETRDPYTAGHQRRVSDLARAIATEMGLSHDRVEGLRVAAIIHDIGKLSVPAEILSKPSKLTKIEFSLIQTHVQSGYDILKDIEFPWPIARMVIEHHERINGSGYPNGLTGDNLLLESRILAVADVVEAMASHRPYRAALGIEPALEEIEKNKGILYDAAVADACVRLFRHKSYMLT